MKIKKPILALVMTAIVLSLTGCGQSAPLVNGSDIYEKYPEAHLLKLEGSTAMIDGTTLEEFDYTWHADPSLSEARFEGTEPDETLGAYIAHDIITYKKFRK